MAEAAQAAGPVQVAKHVVVRHVLSWYDNGSELAETVPALREITDAQDTDAALLCCLVLEQALVDGLYDFAPPRSIMVETDDDLPGLLASLRQISSGPSTKDVVIRARLACALADASLTADSSPARVEDVYGSLLQDAAAGRHRHARGLIAARGAHAFAVHGAPERAQTLWQQSVLASSEDGLYGDARWALRSLRMVLWDHRGKTLPTGLDITTRALPNNKRMLAAPTDPALLAYEAAHRGEPIGATADVRRYLWEARLSGALQEQCLAMDLFGDILLAQGYPALAVEAFVCAGMPEKADEHATPLPEPVDMERWLASPMRRRSSAASAVLAAQNAVIADEKVPGIIAKLLHVAQNLWTAPPSQPHPELDSLKAVTAFGIRIPKESIDVILTLSGPALSGQTRYDSDIAYLLLNAYWAVPVRAEDLASALEALMQLPDQHELWSALRQFPSDSRPGLVPALTRSARKGIQQASDVLAAWQPASRAAQLAARRACAFVLRAPLGTRDPRMIPIDHAATTVAMLLGLLNAAPLISIPPEQLNAEPAEVLPPGTVTPPGEAALPSPDHPQEPDDAAFAAAQPPGELAQTVAEHLTALAGDIHASTGIRQRRLLALPALLGSIPSSAAAAIAQRLLALSQTPPPTTGHAHTAAGRSKLAAAALQVSAEAFAASRTPRSALTDADRAYLSQVVAAAMPLLRSDDRTHRILGARCLSTAGRTAEEFAPLAAGLAFHGCEHVRSISTAHLDASDPLLAGLAQDPSPPPRQDGRRHPSPRPASPCTGSPRDRPPPRRPPNRRPRQHHPSPTGPLTFRLPPDRPRGMMPPRSSSTPSTSLLKTPNKCAT
ncbi:hypothetical protein [Streptomyces sp. NPDC008139]|uniref:hypothetical protein n=1 Tax=Streptomyces sp. NPDC008139 TaxID=3364814 RepID=UPI0036E39941